jgi:hypothetical protein
MESSLITAMAAVLGSLVGGSATLATAWLTQRSSARRELTSEEVRKREKLYSEFIGECSKLAIDSLTHSIEQPEKMLPVYALLNCIRLTASQAVLTEAEKVLSRIATQYYSPNISQEEFRTFALSREADPLETFGRTCRSELKTIRSGG